MRQGLELQLKTKARVQQTAEGHSLLFGFWIGPINVFVIAGLPTETNLQPKVYIKITLGPNEDWELYKFHRAIPQRNDEL